MRKPTFPRHSVLFIGLLLISGTGQIKAERKPLHEAVIPVVPTPASYTPSPGTLTIRPSNRVLCSSEVLMPLAKLHTSDIRRTHGVQLAEPATGTKPSPGDIILRGASDLKDEAYRINVIRDVVTIEAGNYDGLAFALMTHLQLLTKSDQGLSIPQLRIADHPYRQYRALQSTVKVNGPQGKGNYYGLPLLKKHIELCRFYKVRYFQIQTSESQWMFATLKSSDSISQEQLEELNLYSRSQWEDLIRFAAERGVHLIPHNESTPAFGGMATALIHYGHTGNDWLKELYSEETITLDEGRDGVVTAEGNGVSADDPDYQKAMELFTRRSYRQFASSFLNKKLPTYHMGPVFGEGGTTPDEMAKILGHLRKEDPDVKLVFWGGPNPIDPVLQEHKDDIIVDLYSSAQLHAPMQDHLDAGLAVINASWRPTYILPDLASSLRDIFNTWNLFRMGTDGVFDPVKYTEAEESSQVIGALFSQWDFASPHQGQLDLVIPRLPVWSERLWNHKPFKTYTPDEFDRFLPRLKAVANIAGRFLADEEPPSPPKHVSATRAVYGNHIQLNWLEATNFPTGYEIYRSSDTNPENAQLLATVATPFYRDSGVRPGVEHHYWIKAVNLHGKSAFSNQATGSTGSVVQLPVVYEPFAYSVGTSIHGQSGGTGMGKDGWTHSGTVGRYTVTDGLTYSTLETQGGALSIHPNKDGHGPEYAVSRPIDGVLDVPGTKLWFSFLFKVNQGGGGEAFFSLNDRAGGYRAFTNDASPSTFGLRMGGRISRNHPMDFEKGEKMPGKTYFMVMRFDFVDGNDRGYFWVNPGSAEPDPMDAMTALSGMVSVGRDDFNGFIFTPHGNGSPEFILDELRIGPDYASVAPGIAGKPLAK